MKRSFQKAVTYFFCLGVRKIKCDTRCNSLNKPGDPRQRKDEGWGNVFGMQIQVVENETKMIVGYLAVVGETIRSDSYCNISTNISLSVVGVEKCDIPAGL